MFLDFSGIHAQGKVLLTDSRFLSDPGKSIFFAIKGERHDGHQYIKDLFEAGIRDFVVEQDALYSELDEFLDQPEIRAYKVKSSIKALQSLAKNKRQKFTYPVVSITGSNGKTIVKEWLSTLLDFQFDIVRSPRSYNSQIGVALSVWEMTPENKLAIFEAGISQKNEMAALEEILRPNLGIFTNIGTSHNEGFGSVQEKIREKLQLFIHSEALIYCSDFVEIEKEIQAFLLPRNPDMKLISWSKKQTVFGNKIHLSLDTYEAEVHLPFSDDASVENAVNCAYAGLYLLKNYNSGISEFLEGFKFLNAIEMRLELKEGREGNYIIDDTYNNDLGGLKMALNFMSQTHTKRDKVLVISDMYQSGLSENVLFQEMLSLIRPQKIKRLITVGESLYHQNIDLGQTKVFQFSDTSSLLESGILESIQKSLVLVKGARAFSFENIVEKLIKRIHGTVLEINLDAITHNLNFYRNIIGKSTKLMVMVKALAYGSGNEVAAWLQYHKVDYLAVAYPDEGVILRQNGITLPIMVMNADPNSFSALFEHNLEPEIYSLRVLQAYVSSKNIWVSGQKTKIHIKIDTGMHRLGFMDADIETLVEILNENPKIEVASIFSHLAGADTPELNDFSEQQIKLFERISQSIIEEIAYAPLRHISNTAGILRFPEARFDMVRLGIGMYGVESSGIRQSALETVATMKTTISQIKTLAKTETVGYSRGGNLERDSKIATIAVGYADGYDRRFSKGKGLVNVNGKLCKTVGNVCMDMTMIDVTEVDCKEGDEVIIFGGNPSISELSQSIGTIPYEILTGVSERVKRVFYHQ